MIAGCTHQACSLCSSTPQSPAEKILKKDRRNSGFSSTAFIDIIFYLYSWFKKIEKLSGKGKLNVFLVTSRPSEHVCFSKMNY
jgi:hypothetical protein